MRAAGDGGPYKKNGAAAGDGGKGRALALRRSIERVPASLSSALRAALRAVALCTPACGRV